MRWWRRWFRSAPPQLSAYDLLDPPTYYREEPIMRLRTIWTMPAMSLRERFNRTGEAALIALAHRLPRALAYRSFIDTGVRHMKPNEVVTDVRYTEILERFPRR